MIKTYTENLNKDYPLYRRCEGQDAPQPAHLVLDADGDVRLLANPEVGSQPASWTQLRCVTWHVSPYLTGKDCRALLDDRLVQELLERVHKGHEVPDGAILGHLDQDGIEAAWRLQRYLDHQYNLPARSPVSRA